MGGGAARHVQYHDRRFVADAARNRRGQSTSDAENLERVAGIEPAYSAWKAAALPLSYTRITG